MSTGYSTTITWTPALDASGKPIRINAAIPEPAANRRSRLVRDILTHLSSPDADPITALVEMVVDLQDANFSLDERLGYLERMMGCPPCTACQCGKC